MVLGRKRKRSGGELVGHAMGWQQSQQVHHHHQQRQQSQCRRRSCRGCRNHHDVKSNKLGERAAVGEKPEPAEGPQQENSKESKCSRSRVSGTRPR